jgi:hypothetical protein
MEEQAGILEHLLPGPERIDASGPLRLQYDCVFSGGDLPIFSAKESTTGPMTRVTITGWREGLNKVQLNHLLRQHAGHGLAEAERAVDGVLAGESYAFESPDPESARAFCRSASAIGAVCSADAEGDESESRAATTFRTTGADA